MMNVIQYTGELVPVEWSERPLDGVVDLWLRKNPRTDVDPEGNTVQIADEAYMVFEKKAAPTRAEVEADFDAWFAQAIAPETTLQDAIDSINVLFGLILGGE